MSYLFSGLFIGPTSQAPRFDEARHDSLYELEIAMAQVPHPQSGQPAPLPWLVDRLFRNLLVDVTGNTHRSEICIDKLYSPRRPDRPPRAWWNSAASKCRPMPHVAGAAGAHPRSDRPLLAAPAEGSFARWGTTLHDRFMLPHYVWADFLDVLGDLDRHGFKLDPAWFAAQLEFRFPFCGEVEYEGVKLELRQALEPWHVMGEQGAIGGTVRFVDSSVERLQVKLEGINPRRYAGDLQSASGAAANDRSGRHRRRRRTLQGLAPASGLHPAAGQHAAGLRYLRSLDSAPDWRLCLPRRPSRRPQLRDLPGQRQRGRSPAPRPLRAPRTFCRPPRRLQPDASEKPADDRSR
jgi:uncharacterized protein (DUF2126 family)